MFAAGEGTAIFDHQFPVSCRKFPVNVLRAVANAVGTDITDFTMVVSFTAALRKLRYAGRGFRDGGRHRISGLRKDEQAAFHGTVRADGEDAEKIADIVFSAGENNPPEFGHGYGHRKTVISSGRNGENQPMVIGRIIKGISDVQMPDALQCTEITAVMYRDDHFDKFSRRSGFFLNNHISFDTGSEPPSREEGRGKYTPGR